MSDSPPDAATIEKARQLNVLDAEGKQVSFGSLIEDAEKDTIVVFIRHFFCGACQLYVNQLATIKPEALAKANKKIVVIGCGDYQPVNFYAEWTQFQGPIYADPSRGLFKLFDLKVSRKTTPKGEERKSYLTRSFWNGVFTSIKEGYMGNLALWGKEGNTAQNGGEFIFTRDGKCTFAYRMKHTEDHVEVADLMREAGVEYP